MTKALIASLLALAFVALTGCKEDHPQQPSADAQKEALSQALETGVHHVRTLKEIQAEREAAKGKQP